VDMKYHIHIHIHIHRCFVDIHGYIHIHRCLSCVHVYAVSNYKKHSYFLLSTGSIFTAFMTKHKIKKHTQVRSVLCYRVSVQKKIAKVTDSFQHSVLYTDIIYAINAHIEVAISRSISECQSDESGEFAISVQQILRYLFRYLLSNHYKLR